MTPSTHPPAALVQPHVLVVDDDPTIRDLVSDYLGKNELRFGLFELLVQIRRLDLRQ